MVIFNVLIYFPDASLKDTSFLPVSVVSGYLYGSTGDKNINLINAMPLANEKGIKLNVIKSEAETVSKSLKLTVTAGNTKFTVTGKKHLTFNNLIQYL